MSAPLLPPGYPVPPGGLPPQDVLLGDRAVFTEAYAVLPRGVLRDIVTSALPHWHDTRLWVLARPMSGFATTFSQYVVEVAAGGGTTRPESESGIEAVLFVVDGTPRLDVDGHAHTLEPGTHVYLPPDTPWSLVNADGAAPAPGSRAR